MAQSKRQYWLWVTRPKYYLDENGNDCEDLDPNSGVDSDGWWTCNKATEEGDLVFLYRAKLKKDIGYLIQAESDAYSIADDNDQRWDWACDYQVLYKFDNTVNIKEIKGDPYLGDWGARRANFQGSSFKIPDEHWARLNHRLGEKNPDYVKYITQIQKEPIATFIKSEKDLEDALVNNLSVLKKFGYDLELYIDSVTRTSGRQFVCKGNGGRIDLLCSDKKHKRLVVIELKNVKAGQNTFGQISNYVGWVQGQLVGGRSAVGLVISRGYDAKFKSALKITDRVKQLNVEDLGFTHIL